MDSYYHMHVTELVRSAGSYSSQVEARVVQDVCQAVGASPGLKPLVDLYTSTEGRTYRVVKLSGTIPYGHLRATYYLPINLWILPWYPAGAPDVYIMPANNMIIAERHRNVDRSGKVYLPELATWDANQSNIVLIVTRISAVFSENTPLYTRVNQQQASQTNMNAAAMFESQQLALTLTERVKKRLRNGVEEAEFHAFLDQQALEDLERNKNTLDMSYRSFSEKKRELNRLEKANAVLLEQIEKYNVRDGDLEPELVAGFDHLKAQHVQCRARDCALQEMLDILVDAKGKKMIDIDKFIDETTRLASEQYTERAMYNKIKNMRLQRQRQSSEIAERPRTTESNAQYKLRGRTPADRHAKPTALT